MQGHGVLYWIALAMAFISAAVNGMEAALAKNEHDDNLNARVHSPVLIDLETK